MDHVAILKKDWDLVSKIINKSKTIETRWYKRRFVPWNKIKQKDTIYFKNSSEKVKVKSKVKKIQQYTIESSKQANSIIQKVWEKDGLMENDIYKLKEYAKNKKYCIIIYLEKSQEIKPFDINKSGFSKQTAWITINNINKIKK